LAGASNCLGCHGGRRHCSKRSPRSSRAQLASDEYIAECQADDHEPPAPITERKFSGKFVVRTSPALHTRLAVEAAEQNVSLNQWAVQKLADRSPIGLFDL
jgi:predicted HicB family RNase H-like nuclease